MKNRNWIEENLTSEKIGEVAEINPPLTADLKDISTVSFLGMTDVSESGKILRQHKKNLDTVKTGFTAFQDDDILVAKITPCFENGKGAIVSNLIHGVGFGSTEFHVLRARECILPEYLFYQTRSSAFRKLGEACMVGSAGQKRVQSNFIETFRIYLPSLSEQKKIAAILSTWDRAIETCEKLITAKVSRKRALMQQLLTGKKRFAEFVKTDGQFNARYFPVPTDWKYVRIGDVAREVSIKNIDNQMLPVLSCTKYKGLVDSLSYFGKQIYSQNLSSYKVASRGQFAYATNHIEEGSIGYQNLYDKALISPMYTVFTVTADIDHSFLFKLVKTETFRHIFEANTSGSIDRRGGLRWHDFAMIKIPLPSLDEQRRIANLIEVGDEEIRILVEKLDAVRNQKRGLMQLLLTGKKRVNVDVSSGN
jgi:type I restriction enzyme, S subunit